MILLGRNATALCILALLTISAASLLVAPQLMPASYSWLAHTTSESGAQGVENAWVARLGFLAFGLAVIWLSAALKPVWINAAYWPHVVFGVCMTATAAFSHRSWIEGAPFDPVEDGLHSFTATAPGRKTSGAPATIWLIDFDPDQINCGQWRYLHLAPGLTGAGT